VPFGVHNSETHFVPRPPARARTTFPGHTTLRTFLLSLLALSCACASASASNLVANGGFEIVPDPGVNTVMLGPGSTALSPWVVTAGEVEGIGQYYWAAAEGLTSLSLNGNSAGTIAQSFPTVPGTAYMVSFELSGDAFSASPIKHLRVRAAGAVKDTVFDSTPAWHWNMAWTRVNWTFQAIASTTTLEFVSMDAGAEGPALDGVQVVPAGTLDAGSLETGLALAAVTPNPASGPARVSFTLPRAAGVRLAAYDVRGREVVVLADGDFAAGPHGVSWDARSMRPGVYVLRLSAGGAMRTQRVAVVR